MYPDSAGDHRVGGIGRYGTGGGELVNMGSLIAGLVFVILGVLFLLDNLGVFEVSFAAMWPIVLIGDRACIAAGRSRPPSPGDAAAGVTSPTRLP